MLIDKCSITAVIAVLLCVATAQKEKCSLRIWVLLKFVSVTNVMLNYHKIRKLIIFGMYLSNIY